MSIRQTVVNLNPSDGVPAVRINQYDIGTTLVFVVIDGDEPAVFASGTTCTLEATRPSGTGYTVTCELRDNIVTVNTTSAMSQEYGDTLCELRFKKGSTNVGTGNFKLGVEKSAKVNGTIEESIEQWTALAQQIHADMLTAVNSATTANQAAEDTVSTKNAVLAAEQSALLAAKRAQDYMATAREAAIAGLHTQIIDHGLAIIE